MSTQENTNKISAGLTAVNNHDVDGFVRLLEPGFKLFLIVKPEKLIPQGQVDGADGFGDYLKMLYSAFENMHFEQQSLSANGNMVYQELLVVGKHSGPLLLPDGREIQPTQLTINMKTEVFHTFNNRGGFLSSTGNANLLDIIGTIQGLIAPAAA